MTFATRLKSLRKSLGLSQAKAATLLGIGKRTIERYEHGQTEPNLPMQQGILTLLSQVETKNRPAL